MTEATQAILSLESLHLLGDVVSGRGPTVDFGLLHALSVRAVQAILPAIEDTAAHREKYSPS